MGTSDQVIATRPQWTPSQRPENRDDGSTCSPSGRQGYGFYWTQIKRLAPDAILLRGPSCLNPAQAAGPSDLDILLTTGLTSVESFLLKQGFHRSYKPQAYLRRFQLFLRDTSGRYTIEFYTSERWGLGFRLAKGNKGPADPNLARLLHATVDGKGPSLFPDCLDSDLLPNPASPRVRTKLAGYLGRALWKRGNTKLLTTYLVLMGLIRPDFKTMGKSLLRKFGYRLWQFRSKTGLEVGLMGPDGAGKSSLARALRELPLPVRIIYMGHNEYHTKVIALVLKRRLPAPLKELAAGCDFFMRRLRGWILSRRGWVIIYDRHPAERLIGRPSGLKQKIVNYLKSLYAWPLDLTFWLTGDYEKIYTRKKEQLPCELEAMDRRFHEVLRSYEISFDKIDVTQKDAESVFKIIADRILTVYQHRHSLENFEGLSRTMLR